MFFTFDLFQLLSNLAVRTFIASFFKGVLQEDYRLDRDRLLPNLDPNK